MTGERGQATVELAALLPLVVVIALAGYALLAGLAAGEQAGVAAEAGAIALLQDRDATAAARDALPARARRTASVRVEGRRVTVAVRPRVPLVARLLRTRVERPRRPGADAVTLRARALEYFVEPRSAPPPEGAFLAPVAAPRPAGRVRAATRLPLARRGARRGRRTRCRWARCSRTPCGRARARRPRRSAPGLPVRARRCGAGRRRSRRRGSRRGWPRRGLPATARGRLAWMALDAHPVAAAVAARRAAGALEVPLVVVLAGPRCEVVEGLLAEQDLVVVACAEPDGAARAARGRGLHRRGARVRGAAAAARRAGSPARAPPAAAGSRRRCGRWCGSSLRRREPEPAEVAW